MNFNCGVQNKWATCKSKAKSSKTININKIKTLHIQVIISCSTCSLVGPVRATWVCASFNSNQVIISCSTCCLVGPVKATWVCASFDSNLVIISCSTCCLVGQVKATWVCASFKEKAELFNHFFVNQCSLLSNNSVLPTNLPQLPNKCLDSIHFSSSDIAKIISHLDPNKGHGHDMLSIRMIKLCGNSICKSLSIIFNDCLNKGKFPHEWQKANVVPVHIKGNKQSLKNYRPISLLPICSKIFERLMYNEMFNFPFLQRTI